MKSPLAFSAILLATSMSFAATPSVEKINAVMKSVMDKVNKEEAAVSQLSMQFDPAKTDLANDKLGFILKIGTEKAGWGDGKALVGLGFDMVVTDTKKRDEKLATGELSVSLETQVLPAFRTVMKDSIAECREAIRELPTNADFDIVSDIGTCEILVAIADAKSVEGLKTKVDGAKASAKSRLNDFIAKRKNNSSARSEVADAKDAIEQLDKIVVSGDAKNVKFTMDVAFDYMMIFPVRFTVLANISEAKMSVGIRASSAMSRETYEDYQQMVVVGLNEIAKEEPSALEELEALAQMGIEIMAEMIK